MVVGKPWFQAITNLHMGVNWDSGPNQGLEKHAWDQQLVPNAQYIKGNHPKHSGYPN